MKLLDKLPKENARSYAIRVLLHNIINLELAPGNAISENELSNALGISRTPVREALIELSRSNLVEILPQRGSYISKIDYELVEETNFLRCVVETAICKEACKHIDEKYIEALEKNLAEQRIAYEGGNIETFLSLDNQFHKLLFESVGKARSYKILMEQMIHLDRLRFLTSYTYDRSHIIRDHEQLLYAIKQQDVELAEFIINRHLNRLELNKAKLLERYPNYFITDKN